MALTLNPIQNQILMCLKTNLHIEYLHVYYPFAYFSAVIFLNIYRFNSFHVHKVVDVACFEQLKVSFY
mgnify:CR=1 FL=1